MVLKVLKVLEKIHTRVRDSQSLLAFERPLTDGVFGYWDEYLTLAEKKVYQVGVPCDECFYSFKRIDEDTITLKSTINRVSKEVREKLDNGLTTIDETILGQIKELIPDGDYTVVLTEIIPTLVTPHQKGDYFIQELVDFIGLGKDELPHDTKTCYYRTNTAVLPGDSFYQTCFYEFIVPIQPLKLFCAEQAADYEKRIMKGAMPTVIALSKLKWGEPPHHVKDEDTLTSNHVFLTHYLVDGLAQVYAAAQAQKPITLLFFVPHEHGADFL